MLYLLRSSKRLDRPERVCFDRSVGFDDDEAASWSCWQVGKSFGCGMLGVAIGGDDNVIRFSKIELKESFPKPLLAPLIKTTVEAIVYVSMRMKLVGKCIFIFSSTLCK